MRRFEFMFGLGCEFVAGAIMFLAPQHRWIGWIFLVLGLLLMGWPVLSWLLKKWRQRTSFIPLHDAARQVYEAMRQQRHLHTSFIDSFDDAEMTLVILGQDICRSVPVVGAYSPGTCLEPIDDDVRCHGQISYQNGVARLQSTLANKSGTFTQIAVKKGDLARVLTRIRKEANDSRQRLQETH